MRLIDEHGTLTAAGTYYYDTTGSVAPDRRFDYSQEPTRCGARIQIRLLDGSLATVRSWDGVKRQWRFTKLGQKFYHESQDSCVVTFPAKASRVRVSGTVYSADTVVKSTETELGIVKLRTLMSDADHITEVKRRVAEYLRSLPIDEEPRPILIEGGAVPRKC